MVFKCRTNVCLLFLIPVLVVATKVDYSICLDIFIAYLSLFSFFCTLPFGNKLDMVMMDKMEKPSPNQVGREFVRQYYTLLNKAPELLHRYIKNFVFLASIIFLV